MKDATEQDLRDEKYDMYSEMSSGLKNLLSSNGYVDEFIGSWHRYVDAQESKAESLRSLANSFEIISETYKLEIVK